MTNEQVATEAASTLDVLFSAVAERFPQRQAVIDVEGELVYRELDRLAQRWAAALSAGGLRRGDMVVLYLPRGRSLIAALCATVRLGGVVVPVSHDIPTARLQFIVTDASATHVLVDTTQAEALGQQLGAARVVDVHTLAACSPGPAPARAKPEDLAYLIYTSGTTGHPKGAMTTHAAITTRYRDWCEVYGLEQTALRILQVAKAGFDVFIGDVVKALGSGGTLVICPDMVVLQPDQLYRWLVEYRIDYVDTVPAVLRNLVEYLNATNSDLAGMKMLNCGADLWTRDEYLRFRAATRVQRLFNSYGVTECAVESTIFEDDGHLLAQRETLPIGRALPSERLLIVDAQLRPVAANTLGQLCLGGPCVSPGYVNLEERNQQVFVEFEEDGVRRRYYLTGDLARIDEDGIVEFAGRTDSQIKINGNRVEIHEIERLLERHPGVRQAVAHYDAERSLLQAFVVAAEGQSVDLPALTALAAAHLPPYMRPRVIRHIDRIPLNQNHKVDRKALQMAAITEASKLRRKKPNELYRCRSVDELSAALAARNIHVTALVDEFIKPSARRSILVGGSLAEQTASAVSDLDLLILLDSEQAFKKHKSDLYGHRINYLPSADAREKIVSLILDGLEIECQFLVDTRLGVHSEDAQATLTELRQPRLAENNKFLCRLSSSWVVHDDGLLATWRRCYDLANLRIRRTSEEFIASAKNLEDMAAAVGEDSAHLGVMGIYVASHLMLALLAHHHYFSKSAKWMKKVTRLLADCPPDLAGLLTRGRDLIGAGAQQSLAEQQVYFDDTMRYCADVRRYLAQDEQLGALLDSLIYDLDITL